ncbi:MAG: hypothetical protein HYX90_10300 [Chloroflexi bacterium]|nr:hypothetical protein [Chloroflexota bacterium]
MREKISRTAPATNPDGYVDLATVAAKLGVTEPQLRDTLNLGQRRLDAATAAKRLGISEESLREALGLS